MKYLAYGEIVEGNGWIFRDDLESIKKEWYFSVRVFEVPDDFNFEEFTKDKTPKFQEVKEKYNQVYSEGGLMHETE